MSDETYFQHGDKHKNFLQIDAMMFDGNGQVFPKFPKQQVSNVFTASKKKQS